MGIYLLKKLEDNSILGIWEIDDSVDVLYNQLNLDTAEQNTYNKFQTNQRRLHWLSYRVMIKQFLCQEIKSISYDLNGKPYLKNSSNHISVSHSGKFSALIYGKNPVGIDIEHVRPKIIPISDKFMSDKEMEQLDRSYLTEQLFVYWGAKEALYKLCGSRNLIFKEDILIEGFPYKPEDTISGSIIKSGFEKKYSLHYKYLEDYVLVYVTS
jgi:4'-phosphopantetheinyl transferase